MYSLRHAAATLPLEAGGSLEAIADMLGHASLNFTRDTYVSRTTELQKKNAAIVDSLYEHNT
jgi:integrase